VTVPAQDAPVRVAVDLLGGDGAPEVVADAALLVASEQPGVDLVLVGPPDLAEDLLQERSSTSAGFRLPRIAPARAAVGVDDAASVVRARADAPVRVAAQLVRDGAADAVVSAGPTGALLTAAVLTLGSLPGVTRPAVAVLVPAARGPVVFLDAGATVDCTAEMLARFGVLGSAYATARLGLDAPRVALLAHASEPGRGDTVRRTATPLLEAAPINFVGNVEGGEVTRGDVADVVVTDGFTGNAVLKAIEGTLELLASRLDVLPGAGDTIAALRRERRSGGLLVGVDGVAVVAHGAAGPRALAACVGLAAAAVREQIVPGIVRVLAELAQARGSEVSR
jgi:phosphate acyltransferase